MSSDLAPFRTITVKIGSALLVDRMRGLRVDWLESLADDIAKLTARGQRVLVVSSGAIALGRTMLSLSAGTLKLEESQAAAAVGQIALAHAWKAALGRHAVTAGQVLLTLDDTETRRRYLNARATIGALLKLGAVPVINENDTVATSEIRYGDNDRLAARVSVMTNADLLVLLSDVDGLYSAPPASNPDAEHIAHVPAVTARIEAMAGESASDTARGGMRTKIEAARIATKGGTAMVIAPGTVPHPLSVLQDGGKATWFDASRTPVSAWKGWIAGNLEPRGSLTVDDGAVRALHQGKSLLPAGVRKVEGRFSRGDTVAVVRQGDGSEVARGLVAYDVAEATAIAGRKTQEIAGILGYAPRAAMIHRDDLVVTAET